ncbi:MAG: CHAD domain-containing protein [Bacteroidota bacterium]
MKHPEIAEITQTKFKKIHTGLASVRLHFHEDDIRLFRVKVKKLGAFLRLLGTAKGHHQALKIPQKIIKYYEVSGMIRSLQLQQLYVQKTLAENQIDPPKIYLKQLSDQILHYISAAGQMTISERSFKRGEGLLLKHLPDQLSTKMADQYVWSEVQKIEQLMAPVFPGDRSLHELRKLLKGLLYVWPFVQNGVGQMSPYSLLSNEENIDAFTIVLGNFHDIDSAIGLLHSGCSTLDPDESETAVLRVMEGLWINAKETTRQDIYQLMEQIIGSGKPYQQLADPVVL